MLRNHLIALLIMLSFAAASNAADPEVGLSPSITYLKQGWSPEERQRFYYTTQGSQLIPYDWFLALRQVGNDEPFRSDANMERLRFIPQPANNDRNPHGLPIGFVKDDNPDTVVVDNVKRSFLGAEFNKREGKVLTNVWLGLTCAACHTSQIEYGKQVVRIDGGPAMADVQTFLAELSEGLIATQSNEVRFKNFAEIVLKDTGVNEGELQALKERLESYTPALQRLVRRGTGKHPYGFARLDAFGAILNEVCTTSLEISENYFPADAPASFPFLWGTPQLDWVQWNGSADNPLARNVGQVIGVFGQLNLRPKPPQDQYKSTANVPNLIDLEDMVDKLTAPVWPEQAFGKKLDTKLAQEGQRLFEKNCASCHALRDPVTNDFPRTPVNAHGKRFVQTRMVALAEIRTDPALAMNFATRKVDPGFLNPGGEKVPRPKLVKQAVKGVIEKKIVEHKLDKETILRITGFRDPQATPPNPLAYKARPLEGIWATAPYLHNGSVPNLYELLLPAKDRSKSFFVGSRQFDPERVGFVTEKTPGAWEFKVEDAHGVIPGNSNAGHEGHGMHENEGYTKTFENGKWREFTKIERCALVEFMKTLGSETEDLSQKIEEITANEAEQINHIVALTMQQLKNRYPNQKQVLRGVHAKDHGCVKAKFEIVADIPNDYRVGIFSEPGRQYDAWVRFSNAATLVTPDDPKDKEGKPTPGSRGMAIKVLGVSGTPLVEPHGALTQDFLLVNHPVFAFANVEDYEVLSSVLADKANEESPLKFFGIQKLKGGAAATRAAETGKIITRIRAPNVAAGAYQPQPASPVDCRYFSGAPFLFGDGYVMKFSADPVDMPTNPQPNTADPNYLRNALIERLKVSGENKPVVFHFRVQKRAFNTLKIAEDIENACIEWPEDSHKFVTVATLTIPPQEFDSPERRAICESLIFTPWHGIEEFRPLGGINRMRRAVYEASSSFRHQPKEPKGN